MNYIKILKNFYELVIIYFFVFLRKILILINLRNFFYPKKIKILSNFINETQNKNINLKNIKIEKNFNYTIKVMNKKFKINKNFKWKFKNTNDDEKISSLHRWHWLLTELEKTKAIKFNEGLSLIKMWINNYGTNKRIKDSYEISERISNLIIFFIYHNKNYDCLSEELKYFLDKNIETLSKQLEFYNDDLSGNHLINNSRALILFGYYKGSKNSINLGIEVLKNILPKLVIDKYFLRESSSHYQLLITSWLTEIFIVMNYYSCKKNLSVIAKYVENLCYGCEFFFVKSNIVTIGDISPDKSPDWLIDVTKFLRNISNSNKKINYKGWANIFYKINNQKKIIKIRKNINRGKNLYFKKSGFCKLFSGNWTFIMHFEIDANRSIASHAHHDFLGFSLFYKSQKFLIDPGRISYENTDSGNYGKEARSHNTICINNFIASHSKADRRIPLSFKKKNVFFKIKNKNKFLEIFIKHDGFKKNLKKIKSHKRVLRFYKNEFHLEDILIGEGEYTTKNFFHWSNRVNFQNNKTSKLNKKKINIIKTQKNINAKILSKKIYSGSLNPFFGWEFESYGKKSPIVSEIIEHKCELPSKLSYLFKIN